MAPRVSPFARPAFFDNGGTDGWVQADVPRWWSFGDVTWDQSAGVFYNVDGLLHIENADGEQLVFMFGTPDLGLTQVLSSTYEVGRTYELTVGVRGGSGGMPLGSPIEISLFYIDDLDATVTLAAAIYENDLLVSPTSLADVTVSLPEILAEDEWAGRNIGIAIRPDVMLEQVELQGGTWGIDNVRLVALPDVQVPGDFDGDTDVDLIDFLTLLDCLSEPGLLREAGCAATDLDGDMSVDLRDFAVFQSALTD